jgi:hypothetical protein
MKALFAQGSLLLLLVFAQFTAIAVAAVGLLHYNPNLERHARR